MDEMAPLLPSTNTGNFVTPLHHFSYPKMEEALHLGFSCMDARLTVKGRPTPQGSVLARLVPETFPLNSGLPEILEKKN